MSKLTTIIAGAVVVVAGAATVGHLFGTYQGVIEDSLERRMRIVPTLQRVVCGDAGYSPADVGYLMESYVQGWEGEEKTNYIFTQLSPDSNQLLAEIGFRYLSQTQKKEVLELMRAQVKYNEQQGEK